MLRIPRAALAAALLAGIAAVGVAQQDTTKEQAQGRGRRAERVEGRRDGPRGPMRGLLRGIDLSQTQQSQVRAIHERYATQLQELRKADRPDVEKLRAAREKGDTATLRAARRQMTEGRERMMALAQKEADEVRGVLTADQQKTFDANRTALQERRERADGDRDGWRKGGRRKPGR